MITLVTLGAVSRETRTLPDQVCPDPQAITEDIRNYLLRDPADQQIKCFTVPVTLDANDQLRGTVPHFGQCSFPVAVYEC